MTRWLATPLNEPTAGPDTDSDDGTVWRTVMNCTQGIAVGRATTNDLVYPQFLVEVLASLG